MDPTGQTFGRLTVLGPAGGPWPEPGGWWRATCDCGRQVLAPAQAIRRGRPCSACQDAEQAQAELARFRSTHASTPGYMGSGWRP
jgi:hypothetical protein